MDTTQHMQRVAMIEAQADKIIESSQSAEMKLVGMVKALTDALLLISEQIQVVSDTVIEDIANSA